MTKFIDLSKSKRIPLPVLREEMYSPNEGKRWSFSYVYYFRELRDIYLAVKQVGYNNLKEFSQKCTRDFKIKPEGEEWDYNGRRILEQLNALRNFGLLNSENSRFTVSYPTVFQQSKIGDELSNSDKLVFEKIYFSYYRFVEMMSWFIDPDGGDRKPIITSLNKEKLLSESKILYPFSMSSRFTDSFIYALQDNTPVYFVPEEKEKSNGGIVRFWDVFVKWGSELGLIEKFSLKNLDYQFSNSLKSPSCIYFKNPILHDLNLFQYISDNYRSKYISVPKLILKIAMEYRYPIDDIKKTVVRQCAENHDHLALQRTSEVFIRNTEIDFVPMVGNSYVSHILVQ